MRRKTIIISIWLISILLAFGLGGFVGTNYSEALENYEESVTDNAKASFNAILNKTIIAGLETQNCTVREAFRNLEQQANAHLDEDQHLAFILDNVPIESAYNDNNVIPSLVTPIRQISVLNAIKLLSETYGVQYTLVPHSRHIIIRKNSTEEAIVSTPQ